MLLCSLQASSLPPRPAPATLSNASYEQASHDPNWIEAMNSELRALEDNQTWSIVPLPHGQRPIGCKWVSRSNITLTAPSSVTKLV
ncbi:hypothetical protein M0R45_026650 [Rubus argutus]|uniref:Uncharacterized protein n=1 Tax=Rubus argutus TaxID=59490 RepID=A0AAW1WXS4_RUBAR